MALLILPLEIDIDELDGIYFLPVNLLLPSLKNFMRVDGNSFTIREHICGGLMVNFFKLLPFKNKEKKINGK